MLVTGERREDRKEKVCILPSFPPPLYLYFAAIYVHCGFILFVWLWNLVTPLWEANSCVRMYVCTVCMYVCTQQISTGKNDTQNTNNGYSFSY